jgi:hypothetical protein
VLRLGIYSDGQGLPANVLKDVTVPADAIGTPMADLTGSPAVLDPGWYHFGGVVQGVTVTQPTVRCCVNQFPDDRYLVFTPSVSSVSPMGYSRGSVTGVLGSWGSTISTTNLVPRLWARVTSAV